ncbi:MAG: CAP domain-containing protein [Saprospiraceae bacterium]|nr:CAP domain-containing protein [Saprospiraceae bacterium]
MIFLLYLFLNFVSLSGVVYPDWDVYAKDEMLTKVNEVRKKGCYCGRRYMNPAPPVKWDETLFKSALHHAMDMDRNNFFAHFSSDGLNIGDRLSRQGYDWQVVGENLGEGQKHFDEVLNDWMESYSHCVMLINPKVEEMAVAKYNDYWVQHFGKRMKR